MRGCIGFAPFNLIGRAAHHDPKPKNWTKLGYQVIADVADAAAGLKEGHEPNDGQPKRRSVVRGHQPHNAEGKIADAHLEFIGVVLEANGGRNWVAEEEMGDVRPDASPADVCRRRAPPRFAPGKGSNSIAGYKA